VYVCSGDFHATRLCRTRDAGQSVTDAYRFRTLHFISKNANHSQTAFRMNRFFSNIDFLIGLDEHNVFVGGASGARLLKCPSEEPSGSHSPIKLRSLRLPPSMRKMSCGTSPLTRENRPSAHQFNRSRLFSAEFRSVFEFHGSLKFVLRLSFPTLII
jgi:hypothetical protein